LEGRGGCGGSGEMFVRGVEGPVRVGSGHSACSRNQNGGAMTNGMRHARGCIQCGKDLS